MKQIISLLLVLTLLIAIPATTNAAQPMKPAELDTINHTQALFQWPAVHGAESYHLQIAYDLIYNPFEDGIIRDIDVATNAVVIDSGLTWGDGYIWRYWWLDDEGITIDTSFRHRFAIMDMIVMPDSADYTIEITNREQVQPGVTTFGYREGYNAAIDIDGNIVGLLPTNKLMPDGTLSGTIGGRGAGRFVDWSIDGDTLFQSSRDLLRHHQWEKLPDGNFLCMSRVYQNVEDPYRPDTIKTFEGDLILIVSPDVDTLWSWSTFDNFSTDEFDSSYFARDAEDAIFDWTHGNDVDMNDAGDAMLMSFRHLHRIQLVSYPEGEIIWAVGKDYGFTPILDHDLNFSAQHDPEFLDNGNFLIYDNHNLGPEDSTRALEFSVDMDNGTADFVWEGWIGTVARSGGNVERQPNGNTLLSTRPVPFVAELNPEGEEVWRMDKFEPRTTYRFTDLYPLVYTVKGPADEQHVPANESYFTFDINNVGHHEQTYRYMVTDSEGWFELEGSITIAPYESAVRTVYGMAAADVALDTVTITVYPTRRPSMVDEWTVVVQADPDMEVGDNVQPETWKLLNSYPNPFNSRAVISFGLPRTETTSLTIYDAQGRLVRTLLSGMTSAGNHRAMWNGLNDSGEAVGSGTYIYVLKTPRGSRSGSMAYIR